MSVLACYLIQCQRRAEPPYPLYYYCHLNLKISHRLNLICVTRSIWIIDRSNHPALCYHVLPLYSETLAHALYPSAHPPKPVSNQQSGASPLLSYSHQNMPSANTSKALMCIFAFISTKRAWQDFRAPRPATEREEKQLKYAVLFDLDIFTL